MGWIYYTEGTDPSEAYVFCKRHLKEEMLKAEKVGMAAGMIKQEVRDDSCLGCWEEKNLQKEVGPMQIKVTTKYMSKLVTVRKDTYANGGVAIQLWSRESPEATVTVWVPGLKDGEVAVKDYSENEGMLSAMLLHKIVAPPHRSIQSGHVTIPVCKLLI